MSNDTHLKNLLLPFLCCTVFSRIKLKWSLQNFPLQVSAYFGHSEEHPFRAHVVFNGRVERTQFHGNSIVEAKKNAAVDFLMHTSVTFKNLPIELGGIFFKLDKARFI